MTVLYQNLAIRQLEKRCFDEEFLTPMQLMLRAANAAWAYCQCRYPKCRDYTIFCGRGNNAGDGLAVARLALEAKLNVTVVLVAGDDMSTPEATQALADVRCAGATIVPFSDTITVTEGVIVDAMLGIGIKGEVREPYVSAIRYINHHSLPVLSLDVPSGLDPDTGRVVEQAVRADATVTFIGLKPGLIICNGLAHAGSICVNDLALPKHWFDDIKPAAKTVLWDEVRPWLQKRQRDAHKGDHGHTLVIGGDYGMGGAVRMAAEAALRVGAGLVTVATRPEHVPIVSGVRPEIMCHQVATVADLEPLLQKCNVVVIGPGLGTSEWACELLNSVLATDKLKVLDADALNLLSEASLPVSHAVLTPHPGEAARLLACSSVEIQDNRFLALDTLVKRYASVIVLKGSGTMLGSEGRLPLICMEGNPGMATAGMGDVLTGVIGGLIAQGLSCFEASQAGVLVHSTAADLAAQEGGERGLLATDLLGYLRELVNPYDNL